MIYTLEPLDQTGALFPRACAERGDERQHCGELSYLARRSDGGERVLCSNHAARFAAKHGLGFPLVSRLANQIAAVRLRLLSLPVDERAASTRLRAVLDRRLARWARGDR